MTKKRKRYPDLNQKLERPWCYYCERDFDDLKILISHQKAKHFKCDRCGRRLNTAGGLSVHMNQVHKETLTQVENALPARQGLDIEIFGMEGVPQEALDQHVNAVTHKHFEEENERARVTGNPVRGAYTNGAQPPEKKTKVKETIEEIAARAKKFREDVKNGILPVPSVPAPVKVEALPAQPSPSVIPPYGAPPHAASPFSAPQQFPPQVPGQPFPVGAPGFPYGAPPPAPFPGGPSPVNAGMPPRPGSIPGQPFAQPPLGFPGGPPGQYPGQFPPAQTGGPPQQPPRASVSQSVDDLIANATGVKDEQVSEKKKKDKNIKLVYNDESISPEEKMARLPRYSASVRV